MGSKQTKQKCLFVHFPSGPIQYKMAEELKINQHFMVPQHIKLTEEQKEQLLKNFNLSTSQLPRIKISDPAIKDLGVNPGDVILIKRKSYTAKETDYYRLVVNG